MKKNIRLILLLELLLFIVVFLVTIINSSRTLHNIINFIDIPSFLLILLVLIPGLIIMGEWKDFIKSFSVGILVQTWRFQYLRGKPLYECEVARKNDFFDFFNKE